MFKAKLKGCLKLDSPDADTEIRIPAGVIYWEGFSEKSSGGEENLDQEEREAKQGSNVKKENG